MNWIMYPIGNEVPHDFLKPENLPLFLQDFDATRFPIASELSEIVAEVKSGKTPKLIPISRGGLKTLELRASNMIFQYYDGYLSHQGSMLLADFMSGILRAKYISL